MSDNEDAATALGNSEPLSVKNPCGVPITQLPQRIADSVEVLPVVAG
jgi:hypothetical protein